MQTNVEVDELKLLSLRLKKIRQSRNISQEKLAELTNLDRTYISSLERGKRNPSYLIIKKLSIALNVLPNQLFGEEDE